MKKVAALGMAAVLLALTTVGCAAAYRSPVIPPTGAGFTQISAPVGLEFHHTKVGGKRGEAASVVVLGLFSFGDASIHEAARDGNITTINHVDHKLLNVFGLYGQYTTIVYGD